MRALDPRLLRRARSARVLLAADAAIGLATALLVLVGATLLARIIARAFHGASLADVAVDIALLGIVFAGRGALAWGFEVAGRRGASTALSELRLALAERRLRSQPAALDGAEAGEVTAAAVQGVDSLEAYFARYLPQVVLACVVPVAVLLWVAPIDLESALIMLLTLPLVPVFMWLIGLYTEQRTRERWQELRRLSTHFLDVVRGLPTLRAAGRARTEAARIAEISERHRQATMGTLRVSFLSGIRARAGRHAWSRARRGDRGRAARRRRARPAGRPHGAHPRTRALPAVPAPRRRVPRERGRPRRRGPHPRPARRAAHGGLRRDARSAQPRRRAGAPGARVLHLSGPPRAGAG